MDSLLLAASPRESTSTLVSDPSARRLWTTHRPTQGWYIRIRSPSLPPASSISLSPVSPNQSTYAALFPNTKIAEGTFTFACRTKVDMKRESRTYPPTPSVSWRDSTSSSSTLAPAQIPPQITQFLVTPDPNLALPLHHRPTAIVSAFQKVFASSGRRVRDFLVSL